MYIKGFIMSLVIIEVAKECFVAGLQCYVCENCNEYEDFRELYICGEINIETTTTTTSMKPVVTSETSGRSTSMKPTRKPATEASSKITTRPSVDDYLYEDSDEKHNVEVNSQNSNQTKTTKATTKQIITAAQTTDFITEKPTKATQKLLDKTSTYLVEKTTTTATQALVTNGKQESAAVSEITTIMSTVSTTKSKPILIQDYDDYVEYEELNDTDVRNVKSLLKVNEPVCYMIKYQVNNTVLTNRGCTSFINASKYLTCQSLHNDAQMESCIICSSNGCNKFLSDNTGQVDNGLFSNKADAPKHTVVVVLLLCGVLTRLVI